jgi:hypothetical protein
MTDSDKSAAEFYDQPENRKIRGPGVRPRQQKRLGAHVPVRFDAETISAVKEFADEDGMTVSSWIRLLVTKEVQWRQARQTATEVVVTPPKFEAIHEGGVQVSTFTTGQQQRIPA